MKGQRAAAPQADGSPVSCSPPAGSWPWPPTTAGAVGALTLAGLDWIALFKVLPGDRLRAARAGAVPRRRRGRRLLVFKSLCPGPSFPPGPSPRRSGRPQDLHLGHSLELVILLLLAMASPTCARRRFPVVPRAHLVLMSLSLRPFADPLPARSSGGIESQYSVLQLGHPTTSRPPRVCACSS